MSRSVNDILIVVTDSLKGLPGALGVVFPATTPPLPTAIGTLNHHPVA